MQLEADYLLVDVDDDSLTAVNELDSLLQIGDDDGSREAAVTVVNDPDPRVVDVSWAKAHKVIIQA